MFKQVSYLKIGEKKGNKRLWIEGKKLQACGFDKGQPYLTILEHTANRSPQPSNCIGRG
jgi:hypothetical protein